MKNLILCLSFLLLSITNIVSQEIYIGYGFTDYKPEIPIEDVRSIQVIGHIDKSTMIVGAHISTGNSYQFATKNDWQSFRFLGGSRIMEFPKVGTHLSLLVVSDLQSINQKLHAVDNGFSANLKFRLINQLYFNLNYYKSVYRYSRDINNVYSSEFFSNYDHYTLSILLKFGK